MIIDVNNRIHYFDDIVSQTWDLDIVFKYNVPKNECHVTTKMIMLGKLNDFKGKLNFNGYNDVDSN